METAKIINKLKTLAIEQIDSEAKVVYFLVEIRKILELNPDTKKRFKTLNLFCDWVVHTKLSGTRAQEFIRGCDATLEADEGMSVPTREQQEQWWAFFTLQPFHSELRALLGELGLWCNPTEDLSEWFRFLKLYASVITDAPLVFEVSGTNPKKAAAARLAALRHVDKISATAHLPTEKEVSEFRSKYPAGRYISFGSTGNFGKMVRRQSQLFATGCSHRL